MNYIHKDYQGTYQAISDENGNLVEKLSFDPCLPDRNVMKAGGRRRNAGDWSFYNVPTNFMFDRGYTGHEHLDKFNLINMPARRNVSGGGNGRVYDPVVARFLSPDPFVQSPHSTQSYNRYSYGLNNPLKYTDPSGYNYKPDGWNHGVGGALSINPYFNSGAPSGYGNYTSGPSGYYYHYGNCYSYETGSQVNYQEDQQNYIVPNSIAHYSSDHGPDNSGAINGFIDALNMGFNFYIVEAFGQSTIVSSLGDIGETEIAINGGISFSNPTAGAHLFEAAQSKNGNWISDSFKINGEHASRNGFDTFLNYTRNATGGAGLAIGGAKMIAKEYVRQVGINNRLAGIKNIKLSGTYSTLKGFGNKLGVIGGVVIAGDILYNSEIQASHGINSIMTGIAFTGWGAPVAGIWFAADFGTGLITGRSISDRIDSSVGSPLVDWEW